MQGDEVASSDDDANTKMRKIKNLCWSACVIGEPIFS